MSYSIALIIMSFLTPLLVISAFIIGYNINTRHTRKIAVKRKEKLTQAQQFLNAIDSYDGNVQKGDK